MSTIRWAGSVDGNFNTPADWRGDTVPGADNRAILGELGGSAYTVTSSTNEFVRAIDISRAATLAITGGVFTVRGTLDNRGTILLNPDGGGATLAFGGVNTLTGGGNLVLGDSKNTLINPINGKAGQSGGLINVDNTISGAGRLGGHGFFFQNGAKGVVDANGTHALVINQGQASEKHFHPGTNAGLMEATDGGRLVLDSLVVNTATGVILAGDASKVVMGNISGGTLQSTGSGRIIDKGFGILDGRVLTLNNQAQVFVTNGSTLDLLGTINNTGAITLARNSQLFAGGPLGVNLTGGGAIHLNFGDTLSLAFSLTNVDNVISGAGLIGRSNFDHGIPLTFINQADGVIDADSSRLLTIDVSINTITNAGTIEATGVGRGKVRSLVDNTGTLATFGNGTLRFNKAVTGDGSAVIGGGTLAFASAFTENVAFTGASGVLQLAQSQGYGGSVTGFSLAGGTSLDLLDIAFVGAGEATFSGTTTSGVLTVTDGTHTAHITLIGDYTASTFVASDDGKGGVSIVDPAKAEAGAAPAHRFVAAMAGLGGSAGGAIHTDHAAPVREGMLFKPRAMIA
jgi:hypothetical protein